MPILGAHMSIAGGYHKAVERAHQCGCDCVQLFTKNNNQWRAKDITPQEAQTFRSTLKKLGIVHPIAHDSYLINLASPDRVLWRNSIDAFVVELHRADRLGIPYHAFAAGYQMETKRQYNATIRALDTTVGIEQIKAFHLNDSRRELGSRVDRHAHIGRGEMGLMPFRHLLNDRRFRNLPMYLETPKDKEGGVDMDLVNLRTLRHLVK